MPANIVFSNWRQSLIPFLGGKEAFSASELRFPDATQGTECQHITKNTTMQSTLT